jgi:hypothetical protein
VGLIVNWVHPTARGTPQPWFSLIIDRQVADHEDPARVDLLALKRDLDDKYHFVSIELKLGRNPDLEEDAGAKVSHYIEHIREHIGDYSSCYEKNYCQKKHLGLFDEKLPESIVINRDLAGIKGIVISSSYSQIATVNIKSLREAIKNHGWQIEVHQMQPMKLAGVVK